MSNESQTVTEQPAPRKAVGEWFWRFLAVVMLFSVGWVLWISYQLNPPALVTAAAFEAAAKAKANQNASGVIAPKPEPVAKEPPVNVDKLKLSDSISAPVAQDAKKK